MTESRKLDGKVLILIALCVFLRPAACSDVPPPGPGPIGAGVPPAPAEVTAKALNCTAVEISWKTLSDAPAVAGFNLYRDGQLLARVAPDLRSAADSGLPSLASRSYEVSAVGTGGAESAKSAASSASTPACNGNHLWSSRYGGTGQDGGTVAAVDSRQNVILAAVAYGAVDFAPGDAPPPGISSIAVAKFSSDLSVQWAARFTGSGTQSSLDLALDRQDNVYLVGGFTDILNFGAVSLASGGGSDIFVAKLSAATGQPAWAKRFGGTSADYANAVAVGPASADAGSPDAVVVTGYFFGTVGFGGAPGQLTSNSEDTFVAKFDTDGNLAWAKNFPGTGYDEGRGVALAPNGEIALIGGFEGRLTFGEREVSNSGRSSAYVARLGTDGSPLWARALTKLPTDTSGYVFGFDVAVDTKGDLFLLGAFEKNMAFEGGDHISSANNGNPDHFVAKYPASGGPPLWRKALGIGTYSLVPIGGRITVGREGDLLLAGTKFTNDTGPWTAFLAKLSGATGAAVWSKSFASTEAWGSDVAVDGNGFVHFTGWFREPLDLGGGSLASAGLGDLFLARFNP